MIPSKRLSMIAWGPTRVPSPAACCTCRLRWVAAATAVAAPLLLLLLLMMLPPRPSPLRTRTHRLLASLPRQLLLLLLLLPLQQPRPPPPPRCGRLPQRVLPCSREPVVAAAAAVRHSSGSQRPLRARGVGLQPPTRRGRRWLPAGVMPCWRVPRPFSGLRRQSMAGEGGVPLCRPMTTSRLRTRRMSRTQTTVEASAASIPTRKRAWPARVSAAASAAPAASQEEEEDEEEGPSPRARRDASEWARIRCQPLPLRRPAHWGPPRLPRKDRRVLPSQKEEKAQWPPCPPPPPSSPQPPPRRTERLSSIGQRQSSSSSSTGMTPLQHRRPLLLLLLLPLLLPPPPPPQRVALQSDAPAVAVGGARPLSRPTPPLLLRPPPALPPPLLSRGLPPRRSRPCSRRRSRSTTGRRRLCPSATSRRCPGEAAAAAVALVEAQPGRQAATPTRHPSSRRRPCRSAHAPPRPQQRRTPALLPLLQSAVASGEVAVARLLLPPHRCCPLRSSALPQPGPRPPSVCCPIAAQEEAVHPLPPPRLRSSDLPVSRGVGEGAAPRGGGTCSAMLPLPPRPQPALPCRPSPPAAATTRRRPRASLAAAAAAAPGEGRGQGGRSSARLRLAPAPPPLPQMRLEERRGQCLP